MSYHSIVILPGKPEEETALLARLEAFEENHMPYDVKLDRETVDLSTERFYFPEFSSDSKCLAYCLTLRSFFQIAPSVIELFTKAVNGANTPNKMVVENSSEELKSHVWFALLDGNPTQMGANQKQKELNDKGYRLTITYLSVIWALLVIKSTYEITPDIVDEMESFLETNKKQSILIAKKKI